MTTEQKNWDDIPALDLRDLQVDWEYQPEAASDKRNSRRLFGSDLVKTFGVPCIPLKIATVRAVCKGILQDISETGLAVRLDQPLKVDEKVKLGFFLGEHKILVQGQVRRVSEGPLGHTCGIMLVDPDEETRSRIHRLYVSVALKQGM